MGSDGELVPDYESTFPEINEGEVVHGTVVRVDKDEVLVDIGYKSEGVIPVSELSIRRSVNPADEVTLGDEIDALVLTKEDAEGRLILSKKRARFELAWKSIERAAESGEPVDGRVIEVVKGGLILDLGVRGFLPASLVDIRRVQDLDEFLGQELRCKVIELNRSRNNVVLSRRAVLEEERKEQRQQILDRLQPGNVVEGQISNIVDFGAFVDLDGMDGLIHISELSWSHVNHPSEVLEIGQTVQVKVLDIDRDRQRISLGLKQTQNDPWQQVHGELRRGRRRRGPRDEGRHLRRLRRDPPRRRGARAHLRARAAPRREPARGRRAGPGRQREDHRDRRRAPPALALAQARRAGRSGPAARRRRRVGAPDAEPRPADADADERRVPRRDGDAAVEDELRSRTRSRPRAAGCRDGSVPRSRACRAVAEEPAEAELEAVAEAAVESPVEAAAPSRSPRSPSRSPSRALGRRGLRSSRGRARGDRRAEPAVEEAAPRPSDGRELGRRRRGRSAEAKTAAAEAEPAAAAEPPAKELTRPVAVAITGGIGAGKSEALRAFARHGAATSRATRSSTSCCATTRSRRRSSSGSGTASSAPTAASTAARSRPSSSTTRQALAWLEELLHPLVSAEYLRWREQLAGLPDAPRVCVTEVPLLYEVGSDAQFDKVVVDHGAGGRCAASASQAAVEERERRFLADDEKVARADFAYVNDGTLEELDAFVAGVMEELAA